MACDTYYKPLQTPQQRAEELRLARAKLIEGLSAGRIKPVVDKKTGAVTFSGFEQDRAGITDACAYRYVMATGSTTAKLAIMRAEQLAGRSVSQSALTHGVHSHDGGKTWHHGH